MPRLSLSLNITTSLQSILYNNPYIVGGLNPPLVLDFDENYFRTEGTATDLVSAATHTRASSATYVDANGILQTAAINEPRVGHHIWNGYAWVDEGYFHESEARTNLVTYSQDLVALGVSTIDATNTSESITATAQAGVQTPSIFLNTTLGTGVHTWWADFTDLVEAPYVVLQTSLFNATANGISIFDLANQSVVLQDANHTARIVQVADGVYRCIITLATDGTDNSGRLGIGLSESTTLLRITDPDGTESVKVLRQQLEAGSTPSSYIPTAGATVTRAADLMTIPAANLPWPSPVIIGPELVTNGTFDSDLTSWTNSNWAWASGAAVTTGVFGTLTQAVGARTATKQITIEYVKTSDRVQCQLIDSTASNTTVSLGGAADLSTLGPSPLTLVMPTGYDTIRFTTTDATAAWTIDNISVKEVNPLAVSIQMEGTMTYADEDLTSSSSDNNGQVTFIKWQAASNQFIGAVLNTGGSRTGQFQVRQRDPISGYDAVDSATTYFSPGINVPFNIASRHGSTFINGAVDGTALTANLTPTALPDLSAEDLNLGYTFMGTIKLFRMWADDLTDEGIAEASAVVFDPVSLFASGEQGAWYEVSTTTCFTDTSGTIAATYGDPVAYLQDLSGNGNHAIQTTLASRPILLQDGSGTPYLDFDGVDDGFSLTYPVGQRTSNMQMVLGVEQDPASTDLQVFLTSQDSSNNPYIGLYQEGSTSAFVDSGSGTPTHHVNNGSDLARRGIIFDALNTGSPVVYEARGFDMTTSIWTTYGTLPSWGLYRTGSWSPDTKFFGLLILGNHTTEELTSAREWMAEKVGVTL